MLSNRDDKDQMGKLDGETSDLSEILDHENIRVLDSDDVPGAKDYRMGPSSSKRHISIHNEVLDESVSSQRGPPTTREMGQLNHKNQKKSVVKLDQKMR